MAKTETQDKSVVVTKLTLKVAGEKLELSVADAKKLYDVLGELFANPAVVVQKEYVFWNYPPIGSPLIPWNQPKWGTYGSTNDPVMGNVTYLSAEVK